VASGTTPHQSSSAGSPSSSDGGPLRTFTDASSSGSSSTSVAANSFGVGSRTSSHRPGISRSDSTRNASTFAPPVTGRHRPKTTAER
jgi:hypothetical protein